MTKLIRLIEDELQKAEKEHPQLVAEYFGGPSVGVYNARQIKKDTFCHFFHRTDYHYCLHISGIQA